MQTTMPFDYHWRFHKVYNDDLTSKHCYFRCLRSPDVDEIKIFDKHDQVTNIICGLVIFIKNLDPINIRKLWAP